MATALLTPNTGASDGTLAGMLLPPEERDVGANAGAALVDFVATTRAELLDDAFVFVPLLPGDNAPIADRLQAIVDWAGGFLHGIGHLGNDKALRERLSMEPLQEMTQDLVEISRVELDDSSEDESEAAIMELEEYLRVVAQTFFDELTPAGASPPLNPNSGSHDA